MSIGSTSPAAGEAPARSARGGAGRAGVELFVISFGILFLELACIRWFGGTVPFLTFFTNLVLMACFLGVSVGCLAARGQWSWINGLVPMLLLAVGSAVGFLWLYNASSRLMIDVGAQRSPQLIYFGTDARVRDASKWVVPVEALAAYFFVLIALMFVGLGQEMGRRFAAIENRLAAYSADVLGSVSGIAAFGVLSYFSVPPTVWFLLAISIGTRFVPSRRWLHGVGLLTVLGLVAASDWRTGLSSEKSAVIWSPYYQVRFQPRYYSIDVNNLGHQGMVDVNREGPAYRLPYLLNRDAGGKPFDDVLIVGAVGNDVAVALLQGVRHVDAVELDPVIRELGRRYHPNRPYGDPRVSAYLDDGRGFIRKARSRYDLICYALVDSLALHSSYSSLRLESFLFTEQAFRDVKARLAPGGVFAMYNFYRQGWVVGRLVKLAETVFGSRPVVVSMPYQDVIAADNDQHDSITCILVGNGPGTVVDSIRSSFAARGPLWVGPGGPFHAQASGPEPSRPEGVGDAAGPLVKLGPARVELSEFDWSPTDDWPFLYLRAPMVPALNLRGIALVSVLSTLILLAFAPVRRARPNGQMFFLGAGFMLLETRGIVSMALLFGATWLVNSIVFFAILTMVLLSNLTVMAIRPRRLWPSYALLLLSLVINAIVPLGTFLSLPGASKVVASCALVYLPVFFAGVIFATVFRASEQPDVDFGSNIGGIILGGLSESLSLVVGFNHLLWVAVGFYVLSALLRPRAATG